MISQNDYIKIDGMYVNKCGVKFERINCELSSCIG